MANLDHDATSVVAGRGSPRNSGCSKLPACRVTVSRLSHQPRKPTLMSHTLMLSCGRRVHAIVQRLTTVAHKLVVDVARIAAHPRRDLRRQQRRDGAVFVRRQDAAISMDERTPCALLVAKAKRPIEKAIDEPLEVDGHF